MLEKVGCSPDDGGHFRASSKSVAALAKARGQGDHLHTSSVSGEQEFSVSSVAILLLVCWFRGNGKVKQVRFLSDKAATTVITDLLLHKFTPFFGPGFTVKTEAGIVLQPSSIMGMLDLRYARDVEHSLGVKSSSSLFRNLGDKAGWGDLLSHLATCTWSLRTTAAYKAKALACLVSVRHTIGRAMDCPRHAADI